MLAATLPICMSIKCPSPVCAIKLCCVHAQGWRWGTASSQTTTSWTCRCRSCRRPASFSSGSSMPSTSSRWTCSSAGATRARSLHPCPSLADQRGSSLGAKDWQSGCCSMAAKDLECSRTEVLSGSGYGGATHVHGTGWWMSHGASSKECHGAEGPLVHGPLWLTRRAYKAFRRDVGRCMRLLWRLAQRLIPLRFEPCTKQYSLFVHAGWWTRLCG